MNELDMFRFSTSQISAALHFRNMEEGSSSSSSSNQPGSSPAIDRYNPIILDPRRLGTTNSNTPPILSPLQPPTLPTHKKQSTSTTDSFASKINNKLNNKKKQKQKPINKDEKRKFDGSDDNSDISSIMNGGRSWRCMNMKPDGFISPPGSSRYLLSEKANVVSEFDPVLKLVPPESCKTHVIKKHESAASLHSSSVPVPAVEQVVVLRVSLHCRGCERKMRKHLSRMEGVKSFNIDFVAKKVTVIGKVTPLEVLANILKVKNAQLWTPPIPHNNFELKKLES